MIRQLHLARCWAPTFDAALSGTGTARSPFMIRESSISTGTHRTASPSSDCRLRMQQTQVPGCRSGSKQCSRWSSTPAVPSATKSQVRQMLLMCSHVQRQILSERPHCCQQDSNSNALASKQDSITRSFLFAAQKSNCLSDRKTLSLSLKCVCQEPVRSAALCKLPASKRLNWLQDAEKGEVICGTPQSRRHLTDHACGGLHRSWTSLPLQC